MSSQYQAMMRELVSGRTAWKDPVDVVATSNVLLRGLQTIDGITLVEGDSVLAAGQTKATQRLVWVASAGEWKIRVDVAKAVYWPLGMVVRVLRGTLNGGTTWRLASPLIGDIQPGSTEVSWEREFSPVLDATIIGEPSKLLKLDDNSRGVASEIAGIDATGEVGVGDAEQARALYISGGRSDIKDIGRGLGMWNNTIVRHGIGSIHSPANGETSMENHMYGDNRTGLVAPENICYEHGPVVEAGHATASYTPPGSTARDIETWPRYWRIHTVDRISDGKGVGLIFQCRLDMGIESLSDAISLTCGVAKNLVTTLKSATGAIHKRDFGGRIPASTSGTTPGTLVDIDCDAVCGQNQFADAELRVQSTTSDGTIVELFRCSFIIYGGLASAAGADKYDLQNSVTAGVAYKAIASRITIANTGGLSRTLRVSYAGGDISKTYDQVFYDLRITQRAA